MDNTLLLILQGQYACIFSETPLSVYRWLRSLRFRVGSRFGLAPYEHTQKVLSEQSENLKFEDEVSNMIFRAVTGSGPDYISKGTAILNLYMDRPNLSRKIRNLIVTARCVLQCRLLMTKYEYFLYMHPF